MTPIQYFVFGGVYFHVLLAPSGALILMMVYYIHTYIHVQLFQIFTQSIDSIDVTSVTLGHLNSINAIDVIRCWGYLGTIFGTILGLSWDYLGTILGLSWDYLVTIC